MPPVRLPQLVVSLIQLEQRLSRKQRLENGLCRVMLTNAVVNWEILAMELAIRFSVRKETSVRWVHLQKLLSLRVTFTTKPVFGTQRSVPQASSVLRQLVRLLKMSRTAIGQLKEQAPANKTNALTVTNVKCLRAQSDRTKKLVQRANTQALTHQLDALLQIVATEMFVTNLRKTSAQTDSTVTWTEPMQRKAILTPNNVPSEHTIHRQPLEPRQLQTVSNANQGKPVW